MAMALMGVQHLCNWLFRTKEDDMITIGVIILVVSYVAMYGLFEVAISVWGSCP